MSVTYADFPEACIPASPSGGRLRPAGQYGSVMPACAYGAVPKPAFVGISEWLDKLELPLEVLSLVRRLSPLGWATLAAELVDWDVACSINPDPPEPFTAEDFIAQALTGLTGAGPGEPRVVQKLAQWVRYQAFIVACECLPPPLTPGNNCTAAPPSFGLGSLGSRSQEFPVTVDQVVLDAVLVFPNGDWQWWYDGSATISGAATDGRNLFIEYRALDGSWLNTTIDLFTLNNNPGCWNAIFRAEVPKFGQSTAIRLFNQAGGTYTISNFSFCFCVPATQPAPLPIQPPLSDIPSAPPLICGTEDLCAITTELGRRLTTIAGQISDIQAAIGGFDQLVELSRLTMTPEGEAQLVLGTRAVSVELTALGDEAFTSALGRPRGLMRVGSVRWGDGVGYSPRRFIDADRFDDVRPAGATTLSWQLLPGTQGILKFLG